MANPLQTSVSLSTGLKELIGDLKSASSDISAELKRAKAEAREANKELRELEKAQRLAQKQGVAFDTSKLKAAESRLSIKEQKAQDLLVKKEQLKEALSDQKEEEEAKRRVIQARQEQINARLAAQKEEEEAKRRYLENRIDRRLQAKVGEVNQKLSILTRLATGRADTGTIREIGTMLEQTGGPLSQAGKALAGGALRASVVGAVAAYAANKTVGVFEQRIQMRTKTAIAQRTVEDMIFEEANRVAMGGSGMTTNDVIALRERVDADRKRIYKVAENATLFGADIITDTERAEKIVENRFRTEDLTRLIGADPAVDNTLKAAYTSVVTKQIENSTLATAIQAYTGSRDLAETASFASLDGIKNFLSGGGDFEFRIEERRSQLRLERIDEILKEREGDRKKAMRPEIRTRLVQTQNQLNALNNDRYTRINAMVRY